MADSAENAKQIRDEGTSASYEEKAIEGIARSWDLEDKECQVLALADAEVWATLLLARRVDALREDLHELLASE